MVVDVTQFSFAEDTCMFIIYTLKEHLLFDIHRNFQLIDNVFDIYLLINTVLESYLNN